ncbi:MAG: hypothetical protein IKL73_02225 [Lachnospiraceae bacterium]|nr:hypothetical protein [Lachnospiraceae bacterium]
MKNKKRIIIISSIALCIIAGIIVYMVIDSKKYIGEKINYTGEPVTQVYDTFEYNLGSGFFENYFVEYTEDYDYKVLIDEYIKHEDADKEVVLSYKEADSIETIPVLGNMYEATSLVVYMFLKEEDMINASVMQIVKESDTIKLIRWYNEIDKSGEIIIDDEMFLTGLINAMKEKDEFEVIAINASGNAVGKEKPKDIIKEYSYAGINNRFVGPFSTIEEMREGYKLYAAYRKELNAKLPIYPWTSASEFTVWPYQQYGLNDEFDVKLQIPLLNKDLEEGVYQTFIFLNKSEILAEMVISDKDAEKYENKTKRTFSNLPARYKNYSKKKSVDEILYSKVVLASWESNPGFLVRGVIFHDKRYFPYGEYNGEMWVYYYESDTFERYEVFKNK